MSTNQHYFENAFTKMRIHIFPDASEETMRLVASLRDEVTLKLTYVVGKCHLKTYQTHNDS